MDSFRGFSQSILECIQATSVHRTAESVLHQKFKVTVDKIAINDMDFAIAYDLNAGYQSSEVN